MHLRPATEVWTLKEWETRTLLGTVLASGDRALVQALSPAGSGHLQIDELVEGLRIEARSQVGVVRFTNFELHVVPKLAGENVGLVRMIDYATGLDALERYPAVDHLAAEGVGLFDLMALLLAEACERLLRGGLHADYRESEGDLPVLRGRLLSDRQLLKRFGRLDRIECRYDEHTSDIAENQILAAALLVCARHVRHERVGLKVRRLRAVFDEVCDPSGVDLARIRRECVYNRLTETYRQPHALAWLILDLLGIRDIFVPEGAQCFSFLLDMNVLFERFLRRWLGDLLAGTGLRLEAKRVESSVFWDVDRSRPYGDVVPDMVVRGSVQPADRLPLDAKYKQYDQKKLDSADLYQAFVYAFALSPGGSARPMAFLLYPASTSALSIIRLQVRKETGQPGAEIAVLGVHIPTALDEARTAHPGVLGLALRELLSEVVLSSRFTKREIA